jgi:hypothetical protein
MADDKMTLEGAYEELKAELAELKAQFAELHDNHQQLQEAFESQKSVSSVQAGGKAEKNTRVKPPEKTFKYNGKTYAIVVGEYINPSGKRVPAATILDDKAEQERLVEIKSGILKEVK